MKSGEWCCSSVIPTIGRLGQEGCEFKASLSYVARPCLKQTNNNNNKENLEITNNTGCAGITLHSITLPRKIPPSNSCVILIL
jgi:hypothetical protein